MNLRQTPSNAETKTEAKAWYQQPETLQQIPAVQAAQTVQTDQLLPKPLQAQPLQQALFDPTAAERILARAGALQEVHGQMLTHEQIEAVAHEIGIKPEFVRLAIEQERSNVLSEPHSVINRKKASRLTTQRCPLPKSQVTATIRGCTLVAAACVAEYLCGASGLSVILLLIVLPLLTSLVLGAMGQSRRRGVISGLAIGTTVAATLLALWLFQGIILNSIIFLIFSIAIACNTLMSIIGAQARRVVSRRLVGRSRTGATRAGDDSGQFVIRHPWSKHA